MKKLYVGNLAYNVTEQELRSAFESCGTVASISLITDRFTNESKGFGFVEFNEDSAAQAALEKLNGHDLNGRTIKVSEARENRDRGSRGGRGGRSGGDRGDRVNH